MADKKGRERGEDGISEAEETVGSISKDPK